MVELYTQDSSGFQATLPWFLYGFESVLESGRRHEAAPYRVRPAFQIVASAPSHFFLTFFFLKEGIKNTLLLPCVIHLLSV
jgi:hypothetical protein